MANFGPGSINETVNMPLLDQIFAFAKAQGITQKELAGKAGIPQESLSRLKGRNSVKAKTLELLADAIGLELVLLPKSKPAAAKVTFREKYKYLAWSDSQASTEVLLRQALIQPDFSILLDAAVEFGLPELMKQWAELLAKPDPATLRAEPITSRMLSHIAEGFRDADAPTQS